MQEILSNLDAMNCREMVRSILEVSNSHPEPQKLISGWNRDVSLNVENTPVLLRFKDGTGSISSSSEATAHIYFTLTKRTLADLMAMRYSPMTAKLTGKIQSSGNMIDILRFASILSASVKSLK